MSSWYLDTSALLKLLNQANELKVPGAIRGGGALVYPDLGYFGPRVIFSPHVYTATIRVSEQMRQQQSKWAPSGSNRRPTD